MSNQDVCVQGNGIPHGRRCGRRGWRQGKGPAAGGGRVGRAEDAEGGARPIWRVQSDCGGGVVEVDYRGAGGEECLAFARGLRRLVVEVEAIFIVEFRVKGNVVVAYLNHTVRSGSKKS